MPVRLQRVEREPASLQSLVVARDAVLIEQRLHSMTGSGTRGPGPAGTGWRRRTDAQARRDESEAERKKDAIHSINFFRSAIASGFATGGRMARKMPSANVIGDRPAASFTSSFAPWSARI